jgi:hypothetical protein
MRRTANAPRRSTRMSASVPLAAKAIPEHFKRIEIEHDLAPELKMCTLCALPHPLTRIGQEIRECYRFEPLKISVEQHMRYPRNPARPSKASLVSTLGIAPQVSLSTHRRHCLGPC